MKQLFFLCSLLFGFLPAHSQMMTQEVFNNAIRQFQHQPHQSFHFFADKNTIAIMNYLDEKALSHHDSIAFDSKILAMRLVKAIQDWNKENPQVDIDDFFVLNTYTNRTLGNGIAFVSETVVQDKKIVSCEQLTSNGTCQAPNGVQHQLTGYKLLQNQYIGEEDSLRILYLTNIIDDVNKDRSTEGQQMYQKLAPVVKQMNYYKKIVVRYVDRYSLTRKKEYSYAL